MMETRIKYIKIDIEYTNPNLMGTQTFTTLVANVEDVQGALMESIGQVEKLGFYYGHTIDICEECKND